MPHSISYQKNPDIRSNANGRDLLNLSLSHELIPINHLCFQEKVFTGGLSYRKQDKWSSHLDWAFCTINVLDYLQHFNLYQTMDLPKDHAPISLI